MEGGGLESPIWQAELQVARSVSQRCLVHCLSEPSPVVVNLDVERREGAMVTITIKLDLTGTQDTFTYETDVNGTSQGSAVPKIDRSNPGQRPHARWKCQIITAKGTIAGETFAVHFKGLSPFKTVRGRTTPGNPQIDMDLVPGNHLVGRFPYYVSVLDQDGYIWTDDPDMIVYE